MSSIVQGVAKQYGDSSKLAARARLNGRYTVAETPWFTWVAVHLALKPGHCVLDIGCGPGWFWTSAIDAMPEKLDVVLADQSLGMVEEAVERCRPLSFASVRGQQADVAALPFADASFDAVIAMHMLYHVADQAVAIAEMHRVLKPGGLLAVTTNGAGNMRKLYELRAVLGCPPFDPAGAAFGYELAEQLMRSRFVNVAMSEHPARLRVTDPEDVFLALTSYPPGDGASEDQLAEFRSTIADAFEQGHGVLETEKQSALFIGRKPTWTSCYQAI